MIVTCEACFTTFNLNDELIKPSGSKVRCSKCNKVFKVFSPVSEDISPPQPMELSDKSPGLSSYPAPSPTTPLDEPSSDLETPVFSEAEGSNTLFEKTDDTFEKVFSEISLDEPLDGINDQLTGVNLETEIKLDYSAPKQRDLSIDDFEKSLEMDFSNISLVSSSESETATDQNKNGVDSQITDQPPEESPFTEDTRIGFNDIETLDLSDIESLIEKQEITASILNDGKENFHRDDSIIVPPPTSSTGTDELLEMDDPYLTFDELQLDKDDLNSATLMEIKETFQPHLSESSEPSTDASSQFEPISPKTISKDADISIDADIDEERMDMGPTPKKGISPLIMIALILTVIAGAGYGGYMLLNSMGISIPFISNPAPSKVSEPGNLRIKPFDISSKFFENDKIGKIFVITGKVKNEYPMARGSVQITGKLYTKDKALAKTETVFCGNVISDIDLVHADAAIFRQRLQNRPGDNRINEKILPGDAIPFMIVFFNLPENLEEFTTEIISSVAS